MNLFFLFSLFSFVFSKECLLCSDPTYLTFGKPIVYQVPVKQNFYLEPYNFTKVEGKIDWNTIENIAQNTWSFIQANKAVIDINSNYANAVPSGVTDWTQLENWSDPISQCFQIDYTNGFGMTVVSYTYCVVYTPGGDYNGVGQYLNHIQIVPSEIQVSWGYTLNAITSVPSVFNKGTSSNPIAAAEVHMQFTVSTAIKKDIQEHVYYVKGDGSFEHVN
jgi:hypothetical protein